MERYAWILLFHDCIAQQLQTLHEASERAKLKDPEGYQSNANVKLFRALTHLIMDVVPTDPGRDEYRQGNTLGTEHRHWRRAKVGRRFGVFFRYDCASKTIVFAWVNDDQTLRSSGSNATPARNSATVMADR